MLGFIGTQCQGHSTSGMAGGRAGWLAGWPVGGHIHEVLAIGSVACANM